MVGGAGKTSMMIMMRGPMNADSCKGGEIHFPVPQTEAQDDCSESLLTQMSAVQEARQKEAELPAIRAHHVSHPARCSGVRRVAAATRVPYVGWTRESRVDRCLFLMACRRNVRIYIYIYISLSLCTI